MGDVVELRRQAGVMFQDYVRYELTVGENVGVPEWFLAVIAWGPLVVGLALVVGHGPRTRYAFASDC